MRDTKKINLIDAVTEISHEKEIDRDILIDALEGAILQAAQRKYTNFDKIEVLLDRKNGAVVLQQYKVVVEKVEDVDNEIALQDAIDIDDDAEIGDEIAFPIDNKEVRNTIAQATRQILLGKVHTIEREIVMKKFSGRIMEIVHGKVARIEHNRIYIILDSNIEGVLERREMLWNDHFQSGEMIRALLLEIKSEGRQHLLVLSRTHPEFLLKLLHAEIPEIYDGLIEVVKVVREAGRKSKIIVRSQDQDIDPVGACIGPRGARISPIITELNGERIDVLVWHDNLAERISEALNVDGIKAITINEKQALAYVEIQEEFLPAAIGKQGQNVRLAQKLTGYEIKFVPFSQENQRKELLSGLFKEDKSPQDESAVSAKESDSTDTQIETKLDVIAKSEKESVKDQETNDVKDSPPAVAVSAPLAEVPLDDSTPKED